MLEKKFSRPKQFLDGSTVVVFDGDVDYAIKKLRTKTGRSGLFSLLKRRIEYPSVSDRRRAKRKKARKRLEDKKRKEGRK